jgi:hypothetical protein
MIQSVDKNAHLTLQITPKVPSRDPLFNRSSLYAVQEMQPDYDDNLVYN